MVGVIDYDAGNVKSVMKAVERLGGNPVLTSDVKVLDGLFVAHPAGSRILREGGSRT